MQRPVLTAEIREGVGKEKAKKLRSKGLIPAIFYGPRSQTIPLVIDSKELAKALQTEAGENVLIDLDIQKGNQSDRKVVMLKDIQIDSLQRTTLHTDFYEVAMDERVTVEVPVHLVGKPEGTKVGGILEQVQRMIQIQCLPGDIPKSFDIDVSPLKIGDSIHVQDIKVENAKIISDTNFTIATVVPPVVEEKVVEAVAPEAAEGAEVKETEEEEKE
ncbi:MAG: 50S ribosomal protein L25 [Deltaproteobacteria bacterium CG_4_8_14_3_um_filter_45_9]|nr:MAG: 50S ribosomal protein L25 [Deltaproteobacteria bacterium CG_4_8_14_3_um_filter_45_9]